MSSKKTPSLNSPVAVRPEVDTAPPYVAGLSIEEIQERYGLSRVVKLASNENPLGTSRYVQNVLCQTAPQAFRYPQSGSPRLHQAVADYNRVPVGKVACANSSDELIDLIIRVRCIPGEHNIIAFKPSFALYEIQSLLAGVEFRQTPLNSDFTPDWDSYLRLADENTRLAFVTAPDNPTGYCPPADELRRLARSLPPACLLIIDEAYMDFCGDAERGSLLPELDDFPNVLIMRTFSKSFGLAGMRLGYIVGPEPVADALRRVRLPFSINILAEAAGIAALEDTAFFAETKKAVAEGRETLFNGLSALGCTVYPTWANFLLVKPPYPAAEMTEDLLKAGIIIRYLKSYGLPDHLRISVGDATENRLLLDTAAKLIAARAG